MADAAIRTTDLDHTHIHAPVEVVVQRDWIDAAVVLAGSALMALGGAMLASYFALPFGG